MIIKKRTPIIPLPGTVIHLKTLKAMEKEFPETYWSGGMGCMTNPKWVLPITKEMYYYFGGEIVINKCIHKGIHYKCNNIKWSWDLQHWAKELVL